MKNALHGKFIFFTSFYVTRWLKSQTIVKPTQQYKKLAKRGGVGVSMDTSHIQPVSGEADAPAKVQIFVIYTEMHKQPQ